MNRETGPPESLDVFCLRMISAKFPVPMVRKNGLKPISNWKMPRNHGQMRLDKPNWGKYGRAMKINECQMKTRSAIFLCSLAVFVSGCQSDGVSIARKYRDPKIG